MYSFKEFSAIIENDIIACIPYDCREEKYINEEKQFVFSTHAKSSVEGYHRMLEFFGYVPKENFFKRLLAHI